MVEAPGYCPPGPKCLFHLTVYRHSRVAPTLAEIVILAPILNPQAIAGRSALLVKSFQWANPRGIRKTMNKLTFALLGVAAITLGGCDSSNQDQVNNAVMNQPNADQLNALADNAANDAANTPAPVVNKARDENMAAPVDNTANPTDAQEQNVSGM